MRRTSILMLFGSLAAAATGCFGYWRLNIYPIDLAERTRLDQIFVDGRRFSEISNKRQSESDLAFWRDFNANDFAAIERRTLAEKLDCSHPKYGDKSGKLHASRSYNKVVEEVRSAERAAVAFAEKQQRSLADRAESDAVIRFHRAEKLRADIECYEMANELTRTSY